jgi:hypothetical protein
MCEWIHISCSCLPHTSIFKFCMKLVSTLLNVSFTHCSPPQGDPIL